MIDESTSQMNLVGPGTVQPITSDIIVINDILVRSNERKRLDIDGNTIFVYDAARYNLVTNKEGLQSYIDYMKENAAVNLDHVKGYVPIAKEENVKMSFVIANLFKNDTKVTRIDTKKIQLDAATPVTTSEVLAKMEFVGKPVDLKEDGTMETFEERESAYIAKMGWKLL
jgi:hypothetical protein